MITSLSPGCVPRGEQILSPGSQDLIINGQNFDANSVVRWNGSDLTTTFLGNTQLTARISPSDIAVVGTAAVTVFNPGAGGGGSNTATFTITAGGVAPQSIAVDPTGKFAYVAEGCGDFIFGYVSMYTVDPITGSLTSVGPPVLTNDEGAKSVAVSPAGTFVYVANWGEGDTSGSVTAYTINATTGTLTSLAPAYCGGSNTCIAPWSVAVDPSGKFVYTANEGGLPPTGISMYTINPTSGALTWTATTIDAAASCIFVAVNPSGTFAYVVELKTNPGSNYEVWTYAIDTTTGMLVYTGAAAAAGLGATSIAVHPSGKFAYVPNSGSNDVSTYSVNSTTGALTSTGTIAARSGPTSIAIHPSGKFAYVVNGGSNDVSTYTIDTTTGMLTNTGTIAAGLGSTSIAVHPSGKFAYVTNSGSNDVSIYGIDTVTGTLTLIGSIGT
jgi:YVTN family beta-propeller protein